MVIGITGRGASGKTTLAKKIIEKYPNYTYVEVDKLVETKVLNSKELLHTVNSKFHDKSYTMNDIVQAYFNKTEKNNYIHSLFVEEVANQILKYMKQDNEKNYIIDWFLLHEIFHLLPIDVKIMTYASKEKRIERSKMRKSDQTEIFQKVDEAFIEVDSSKIDFFLCTEIDYSKLLDDIMNSLKKENTKK